MTAQALPRTAETSTSLPTISTAPARRRLGRGRPIPFGRAIGPVALLGFWSLASAAGWLDPRKLSAPWTVVSTAGDLLADGTLGTNIAASLQRAAAGCVIGVVVGTVLAILSGITRIGSALIDGPVQIQRAIPIIGLAPLLILWLGINEGFKIAVIAIGVSVSMYIQTYAGLTQIDSRYVELAEVQNYSRWEFLRHVVFPGALPGFFVGLRLAVTVSWLILITVEQINALSGVGYMMAQAQLYAQTDIIVVGLGVYGVFGFTSDAVLRLIERRVLSWRRTLTN
jgi:sulfonate transport system permease protein